MPSVKEQNAAAAKIGAAFRRRTCDFKEGERPKPRPKPKAAAQAGSADAPKANAATLQVREQWMQVCLPAGNRLMRAPGTRAH
jgi:hypothetical protein